MILAQLVISRNGYHVITAWTSRILPRMCVKESRWQKLNTLRPRQNGRHFADDIFKCIFLNRNWWISPKISLNFVPEVRINNIPVLIQIMAWCRSGDKPISGRMMVILLTHICVTRPQWVKCHVCRWPLIYANGYAFFKTDSIVLTHIQITIPLNLTTCHKSHIESIMWCWWLGDFWTRLASNQKNTGNYSCKSFWLVTS